MAPCSVIKFLRDDADKALGRAYQLIFGTTVQNQAETIAIDPPR
jgi:hypothetical protein